MGIGSLIDKFIRSFVKLAAIKIHDALSKHPQIQQYWDLRFAVAISDRHYRSIFFSTGLRAIVAIVFAAVALISAAVSDVPTIYTFLSAAIAAFSAITAYLNFGKAKDALGEFRLSNKEYEADTPHVDGVVIDGQNRLFSQMQPSAREKRLGFATYHNPSLATDAYMRSEIFDNHICELASLSYQEGPSRMFELFALPQGAEDAKRQDQLMYLVARVERGREADDRGKYESEVLNDEKYGLSMTLEMPLRPVEVYKVGYYDMLVTNEFPRSSLRLKRRRAFDSEVDVREVDRFDRYFPCDRSLNADELVLRPMPLNSCSNQVGITTLAVTSDHKILFFRQGKGMVIAAGSMVASGSGSVNYSDLANAEDRKDLLASVRYSMARELLEEAKKQADKLGEEAFKEVTVDAIRGVAKNTKIIGFFRWVNRAGKPEFIGITKLTEPLDDFLPDGDMHEVMILGDGIKFPELSGLQDIVKIREQWVPPVLASINNKMSLSAAVCLERLCEIAQYEHADDEKKREMFRMIEHFLFR